MNQEKIDELVRTSEEVTQTEAEAVAKYVEAVEIDNNMVDRLRVLFDSLGVETTRGMFFRQRDFILHGSNEVHEVRASVSIYNPIPEESESTTPDRASEVREVLIVTKIDGKRVESHTIKPYHPEPQASETSLYDHFVSVRHWRIPKIEKEDPDKILAHVKNIAETVDLIVAQYSPEKSDTNA